MGWLTWSELSLSLATGVLAVQDRRWREWGWDIKPILWAFPIHSASSFFLSLLPFLSIVLWLCQSVLPPLLSLFPSLCISNLQFAPPSSYCRHLYSHSSLQKSFNFWNLWPPSCLAFHPHFIVLCVIVSPSPIHFEVSPFFANTLQSHYLSPSIVLVVDYVIRAEDMSFLPTRSSAQCDYTKPFSLLSFFALTKTHRCTHTHTQTHEHGFLNVKCTIQVCLIPFYFLILWHATSSTYTNMGYSMQTLKLSCFESREGFSDSSWTTQSSWFSWAGSAGCYKYPQSKYTPFYSVAIQPRSMKEKHTTDLVPSIPHHSFQPVLVIWLELVCQFK